MKTLPEVSPWPWVSATFVWFRRPSTPARRSRSSWVPTSRYLRRLQLPPPHTRRSHVDGAPVRGAPSRAVLPCSLALVGAECQDCVWHSQSSSANEFACTTSG